MPEVVLHADPGQTDLHEPFFLPDGRRFLYLAISSGQKDAGGIYVGSLDGKLRQRVLDHDSNAVFVAGAANDRHRGYLLFGREGGLMAQAVRLRRVAHSAAKRAHRCPARHGAGRQSSAIAVATLRRRTTDY